MERLSKHSIYRILDANLNRAAEGMRVCEDVIRFVLNDHKLTAQFKNVRHCICKVPDASVRQKFIKMRNSTQDVGRDILRGELKRSNYRDIFFANMQRVKESIRVLEEFSKLIDKKMVIKFKKIRYRVYDIEKQVAIKF